MPQDQKSLAAQALQLKSQGKLEQALSLYRRIVEQFPASAVAEHNLAAALGDAGRWRDASHHIDQAFAKGIDAHQSWLVRARCLQALGKFDQAEAAFAETLHRAPGAYEALRDQAQLRWMTTGDAKAALSNIEAAITAAQGDARLRVLKAQALEHMGEPERALALLSALAANSPDDAFVAIAAAQMAAVAGEGADALAMAERAMSLAPAAPQAQIALIIACLGIGDAERASTLANNLRGAAPQDQHAIALQATAWRMLGDERYRSLHDYGSMVSVQPLDVPAGWRDLDHYLEDLSSSLQAAHKFVQHPFDQSIRHGSQISDVLHQEAPAMRALPQALDGPIKRYMEKLGRGDDPLRARNSGAHTYQGMWSIRMSSGGYHVDHIHPAGWISSACYIELPKQRTGHEGSIRFGQPGVRTAPALEADHYVAPQLGTVVLFPSYMWHGTVPYADPTPRMTVAFDVAPA